MNYLENTLQKHAHILGENYQYLGKTRASGFWGHKKILLSFDKKKGWNVVQLGSISLFFRKLGFFKSTHLNNVAREWSALKSSTDYSNKTLNKIIKDLWKKTYPQQVFPTYFTIMGNCDPKLAKIKIFCEVHNASRLKVAIFKKIKKFYQPEDIILVEGLPANTRCKKTLDCLIQGWEPPENFLENMKKQIGEQFETSLKFDDSFEDLILLEIEQQEDLKIFEEKSKIYLQQYLIYSQFAYGNKSERKKITSSNIAKLKILLKDFMDQAVASNYNKDSMYEEKRFTMIKFVYEISQKICNAYKKNYFNNMTLENQEQVTLNFKNRNACLSIEISDKCQRYRHVYAVMGTNHALKGSKKFPGSKERHEAVDLLHETLCGHKFVIYVKRKNFELAKGIQENTDLHLTVYK